MVAFQSCSFFWPTLYVTFKSHNRLLNTSGGGIFNLSLHKNGNGYLREAPNVFSCSAAIDSLLQATSKRNNIGQLE